MKLRPFELTLVVSFALMALVAIFILKTYDPEPKVVEGQLASVGVVEIWGTVPAEGINSVLSKLAADNESYLSVFYKYISPESFDDTLIRALADGAGPDLVFVSHEKLADMRHRIQPVAFESFPLRDVRNVYLDGAQIFALSDGLYGFPIAVDPLMMYWNRDMFTTKGYLDPPKTWESLVNTVFPDLIDRDFDRTINRSVVAMGEYGNVRNAFGIISTLFIQGGSERVIEGGRSGYIVNLQSAIGGGPDPLLAAADFYTRFSKPSNALYSWNRSFDDDRRQFIAGDLALYFGYGSEGVQIERVNPNLSFDIAEVPQGATATTRRTYAKFYTLAPLKSSDNPSGAFAVMINLGSDALSAQIAVESKMVPVYRGQVALGSNDTFGRTSYLSAPIALGWLNPNLAATDEILETMTEDINENRRDLGGAVSDASRRIADLY